MPLFIRNCLASFVGLCLLAVHCLGAWGEVRTGIGVFDTLYIAGSHGMVVHGDVFLEGAHVLGEGEIQLRGNGDNKIVSHRSEVNHLIVHTHGKVRLEGEIAVNKSLTVRSGAFDKSDGILEVSDSATVRLLNGSQVVGTKLAAGGPHEERYNQGTGKMLKAILLTPSALALGFHLLARSMHEMRFSHLRERYGLVALMPPETI